MQAEVQDLAERMRYLRLSHQRPHYIRGEALTDRLFSPAAPGLSQSRKNSGTGSQYQ